MQKLMNDPKNYVDEVLDGLIAANPSLRRSPRSSRAIVRSQGMAPGRVGVVTGGGSGHLPLFTGYVGAGLLDACAVGNVFEGPTVDSCMASIKAADGGKGVLCLFGNYGGDKMNFGMACEMAELDEIETATVLGTDDIASARPDEVEKRRGVAGIVYAYKAAGARAAEGGSLADVAAAAKNAVSRTRTIGVALASCQIPGADRPTFELPAGELDFGMGIHGEPGIWRGKIKSADLLADEMLDRLLAEAPADASGKVSVLINSLGATPLEEPFILYRHVHARLAKEGLIIVFPMVGAYVTSMEMAGASISISHLDPELERLYAAPAECPFWRVG